jgi:arginase
MTSRLRLISVPYDSGRYGARHGLGPGALVAGGATDVLSRAGAHVDPVVIALQPPPFGEVAAAVAVMRQVAHEVRRAVEDGAAPIVLAGNCGATLGVTAGLANRRTGVLWLDAHGDLNTPETTTSGFVDGMSLSMLTGRSWTTLLRTVEGFAPVPDAAVLLVGAHDLDPAERAVLAASSIHRLTVDDVRTDPRSIDDRVRAVTAGVDALHVHVDLDVHDTADGQANSYAAPGGLRAAEVLAVIEVAAARAPIASATIASWDPMLDRGGQMQAVALTLLDTLGALMTTQRPARAS